MKTSTNTADAARVGSTGGSAPSGFRWVKRGEWLQSTDSYRVEDELTGEVSWKRHDDPFRWKPRKCTTSRNYIRNVKPNNKITKAPTSAE